MNPLKLQLHWQIFIAIVLAIFAGFLTGTEAGIFGVTFYDMYNFLGTLFLRALKMIIVPLIVTSIISGISSVQETEGIGRLGGKTILYYLCTSLFAIITGLLIVNLIQPGIVDGEPAKALFGLTGDAGAALAKVGESDSSAMVQIFYRMVPPNIIHAAAQGQMLGLIVFSLLFGFFIHKQKSEYKLTLTNSINGIFGVMMDLTMFIMRFAPIGVFGLIAKTVATTGFAAFMPLLSFFMTVVIALLIQMLVVLPLILKFIARVSPVAQYKVMMPAILTAFSTSSSAATLPLSIKCVEEDAGVSNRVTSFVLPLGSTINMDGTALYECVAAMFIAQIYGLDLTIGVQFTVVFVALLTSIGVAGVPAASLVAITIILTSIGLPLEGIGLILATDRVLDMMRTSVNIFSDSCGAVVVAKSEGETGILQNYKAAS